MSSKSCLGTDGFLTMFSTFKNAISVALPLFGCSAAVAGNHLHYMYPLVCVAHIRQRVIPLLLTVVFLSASFTCTLRLLSSSLCASSNPRKPPVGVLCYACFGLVIVHTVTAAIQRALNPPNHTGLSTIAPMCFSSIERRKPSKLSSLIRQPLMASLISSSK